MFDSFSKMIFHAQQQKQTAPYIPEDSTRASRRAAVTQAPLIKSLW